VVWGLTVPDALVLEQRRGGAEGHVSKRQRPIGIGHGERTEDNDLIVILDMLIPIIPAGGRINLDAIKLFIQDLRDIGHLNIQVVSFDNFQSEASRQYLKRVNFNVEELSVDKTMDSYLALISLIESQRLRAGKSIIFKNNLRSLRIVKRETGTQKVDHTPGEIIYTSDDVSWESSTMGVNAKDLSDTAAAVCNLIRRHQLYMAEVFNDKDLVPVTREEATNDIRRKLQAMGMAV
jgi:hypothetical protein